MALLTEMVIALGRIVATRVAGTANAVLANLAMMEATVDDTEAETSTDEPMYGPLGFYSRPDAPVSEGMGAGNRPEGQTEVVGLRMGDHVLPIGYRDLRISAKVNPKEGEVGLAQYRGGFISLKTNATDDGTDVCIYSVHNTALGVPDKAHCLSFDSTTANSSVALVHSFGQSFCLTKEGHIVLANKQGSGFVLVKDDTGGVVVSAPAITLNGSVTAGAANPVNANLTVDGTAGGTPLDLVMLATQLLVWVGQVNVALTILAGGAGGLVPPIVAPVAVPAGATKVQAR